MTQADTQAVVRQFYDAFVRMDAAAMAGLYADNAEFSDEVFVGLRGKEIGGMWTMLATRSKDLRVSYEILSVHGSTAEVLWHAHYTFSKTKRLVHNVISGSLTVKDGKIVNHRDRFSFWAWSRQALGLPGFILGWTPIVKNKVRSEARKGLDDFLASRASP